MGFSEFFLLRERAIQTIDELDNTIKFEIKKSPHYRNNKDEQGYELRLFINKQPKAALELVQMHGRATWNIHAGMRKELQGSGFGPLLYDIALEFISNYRNGITVSTYGNGTGSTSDRAENVWKRYYQSRSDVNHIDNKGVRKDNYGFNDFPDETRSPKNTPWLWAGFTKSLDLIPKLLKKKLLTIYK